MPSAETLLSTTATPFFVNIFPIFSLKTSKSSYLEIKFVNKHFIQFKKEIYYYQYYWTNGTKLLPHSLLRAPLYLRQVPLHSLLPPRHSPVPAVAVVTSWLAVAASFRTRPSDTPCTPCPLSTILRPLSDTCTLHLPHLLAKLLSPRLVAHNTQP